MDMDLYKKSNSYLCFLLCGHISIRTKDLIVKLYVDNVKKEV